MENELSVEETNNAMVEFYKLPAEKQMKILLHLKDRQELLKDIALQE